MRVDLVDSIKSLPISRHRQRDRARALNSLQLPPAPSADSVSMDTFIGTLFGCNVGELRVALRVRLRQQGSAHARRSDRRDPHPLYELSPAPAHAHAAFSSDQISL